MREAGGTDAVAQTVGFIVALSFFLGILGVLTVATTESSGRDDGGVQATSNQLEATRLADTLAGSPGVGWAGGADAVDRLGLLADDGVRIDSDRLGALRGASIDAVPGNGKVDYAEALAGLGLPDDGTAGFHVRIAPVGLKNALLQADLSHIRTAYIGDWDDLDTNSDIPLGTPEQMVAAARAQADAGMDPLAAHERAILVQLGLGYDDEVHLDGMGMGVDAGPGPDVPLGDLVPPESLEGDVYPDDKQYLNDVLEGRLPEYHVLVVGSTVDHESLTSSDVKGPIRDWVMGGGTLLVFGSESSNNQWLQPLFHVGTSTANGAPAAPDVSHPMLHEPHPLDWTAYNDHGLAWSLPQNGANAVYDDFQHVISSGDEDVLTISNEGVFGTGRVFLTTYRPSEIAATLSADEAHNFVHNVVLFDDRSHLYLDYGPTPPQDAAVSAALRTAQVWDDDLGMVNVRMTVLYWT